MSDWTHEPKILYRSAIVLTSIFVRHGSGYFLFRNLVLHSLLTKITHRLESEFQMTLTIEESWFQRNDRCDDAWSKFVSCRRRYTLHLDSVWAEPSFSSLITGNVRLNHSIQKMSELSIPLSTTVPAIIPIFETQKGRSWHHLALKKIMQLFWNRVLRQAFNLAPQQAELKNIQLSFSNDTTEQSVTIPSFVSFKQVTWRES